MIRSNIQQTSVVSIGGSLWAAMGMSGRDEEGRGVELLGVLLEKVHG